MCEFETVEEIVSDSWEPMFKDCEMMLIEGSAGTWRGRRTMIPTVVYSTDLSDVLDQMSIDYLSIKVHDKHFEIINSHHDGTNYYTVRPFSFNMLTVKELWTIILRGHYRYEVADFYNIKSKEVNKEILVNFCYDNSIELLDL